MPTTPLPRRLAPSHFRTLAASGLRTPIGTDLVLHERPDPEEEAAFLPRHRAHFDAIAAVAGRPGLTPLGMAIGPFSLTTKLLADPIAAVGLAGRGVSAADEPLVAAVERGLALAELAVQPLASRPGRGGGGRPHRLRARRGRPLRLPPADGLRLFGNLPTKHFYSDETLPLEAVRSMTRNLVALMCDRGRPFILGSECDVLHVPGAGATIRAKVEAMLTEAA